MARMRPVDSSAVAAVGYDRRRRELFVNFVGDDPTYVYAEVAPATFAALLEAPSIGAFVNRRIKPAHRFRRLAVRLH
jgi:hypothetical protein